MSRPVVGIYAALRAEAQALAGAAPPVQRVVTVADGVLLWLGGIGARAAARGCEALMEAGAGALVSAGSAAGLAPACTPGTLVLPRRVIRDTDLPVPVDNEWGSALDAALAGHLTIRAGDAAGSDSVLGREQKHALFLRTGAVCADMESVAVATAAARRGLPLLVLRAVSDGPEDDPPPDLANAIDAFGRTDLRRLCGLVLRRPGDAAALWRLGAGFRAALRVLSTAIRIAGPRLRCPG